MTVAEYMREVLSNPVGGVYAAQGAGAIGSQGHFVTSPEISSVFGEVCLPMCSTSCTCIPAVTETCACLILHLLHSHMQTLAVHGNAAMTC